MATALVACLIVAPACICWVLYVLTPLGAWVDRIMPTRSYPDLDVEGDPGEIIDFDWPQRS